jgi:uncharacterized short protein YbdD (DUF466 family)
MLGRREAARQRGRGAVLARLATIARGISGMPDYQAYIEHVRRCHPETPAMTEREYYAEYVNRRYAEGPSRCC